MDAARGPSFAADQDDGTVLKSAEIERQRVEVLAEATKRKLMTEAEGAAAATRLQGEADADIILKKGEAEAKAMNVKAEAYQEWNQAAVVDKLITGLPEVVKALASPLSNIDKITIVSTGDADAAGMNKVTNDMAKIAAQIPVLFETLSGMKMSELLSKVRGIADRDTSDRASGASEHTPESRLGLDSANGPKETSESN